MKLKTPARDIFKLLLLVITVLCLPEQVLAAVSLAHKEPATLRNTAIICLILVPPLMLLAFFRVQKWQVGRKNREKLEVLAATDKRFDNEKVQYAINETLAAVIQTVQTRNRDVLKARLTPGFQSRYELEPEFFNDYDSLTFDMILSIDSASKSLDAIITCSRKSRKNTRTPSVEEAWTFVESGEGWFLDSVRDVEVSEYVEL